MNNLQIALQAMGMSEKPESRAPTLRDTPVDGAIGFTQPAAPCSKKETCLECSQQWRKVGTVHCAEFIYVNILSNKQAADALQSCVSQVERDFRWLQETLVAQGDLIMARWTRGARASYIKHAFPDLFPKSFPAQRLVLPPGIDWRLARQIYRETFLIPYFNAESLQKDPRRLLSLLHFRTKHDFREFVMLEKQEQEMGFKFGALGLDYNSQCVDMSVTPRYGKLTPFNETKAHTWTIVGYPRAKLILDAQVCLYGNLRRLCEILIQDNNAVRGKKGQWNNFISLGCRSSLSEEQWTPYPNRAFAGPVTLDHGYFCELATSRRAAAEDLMWLLQTDAVYAQHSIRVLSNSVAMNTADEVSATRSIVGELVNSGGDRVRNWRDIEAELHNLHDLANRSGEHKYDLSTEAGKLYNRALCSVEKMLVNVFLHQANRLKSVLRTSNGFEDHFSHKRFDSGETGSALKRIAKGRNENTAYFKKEPIVWCLMQLERDIEDDSVVDYGGLFNVLDEHIEKGTAKQRNLVDQRLYDHISDLAAVHHILSTLRLHRPLHDSTLFHKANHIEKERRYWRTLDHEERLAKLTDPQLDSLGVLMKSFNSIRLPQRQTVAKLSKSVQARRELTVFWSCARQMVDARYKSLGISTADRNSELSMLSYSISNEHLRQLCTDWVCLETLEERPKDPSRGKKSGQKVDGISDRG